MSGAKKFQRCSGHLMPIFRQRTGLKRDVAGDSPAERTSRGPGPAVLSRLLNEKTGNFLASILHIVNISVTNVNGEVLFQPFERSKT